MHTDLLTVLERPKRRSVLGTLIGLMALGVGLGIAFTIGLAALLGRPFVVADLAALFPHAVQTAGFGGTLAADRFGGNGSRSLAAVGAGETGGLGPAVAGNAGGDSVDGEETGQFSNDAIAGGGTLRESDGGPKTARDTSRATAPGEAAISGGEDPASRNDPIPFLRIRPLADWLEETARDAARGLVIGPGLDGDLQAGALDAISWEDRLAAYARVYGFHYDVGPHLIEVVAARAKSGAALAQAPRSGSPAGSGDRGSTDSASPGEKPSARGSGSASASPVSEGPLSHRVIRVEHADAAELVGVLRDAVKGTGVSLAADPSANGLVVSGRGEALDGALALIATLDQPRRRVLLETKMVEVSGSATSELGIEWRIDGDVGGLVRLPAADASREAAALLLGNAGSGSIEARLGILESEGRARVVSRPRIVMLEGKPAVIESARILRVRLPGRGTVVGDEVGVIDTGGGRATEEIPVGVRLEVTPRVASDGTVTLKILAKSSSLGPPLPPDDIPEELSRMVEAVVTVNDGETAVLGGLLRDGRTKAGTGVPLLRDVPGIGSLFGKRSRLHESEELLVLVTPRVLS